MDKQVSHLLNGESFIYRGYFYRATNRWNRETSQRYCEKLAFEMDGEWHTCANAGDWFNQYADVQLARLTVVPC